MLRSRPGSPRPRQSHADTPLCTIAGFYRYAVEEELLDHSSAAHVRRPRLDYESHATGLDRNELGALLVAAGLGPAAEHALISLLALNGFARLRSHRRRHRGHGHRARAPDPGRPAVSARPVSCHQQSETWKHGPGQAEISELAATLTTIRAAEKSGDVPALATGMKKLMPAAVILAKHPIPVCADPGKLYAGFTDRTYTAGYNARSAKGLSGLVKAAARLKGLKTIESRLTAELNHALAKN